MNILLTGGTGSVGRVVAQVLVERGHLVRVIDMNLHDPLPGVQYTVCDITDFKALRSQLDGIEAVIHLADYPDPSAASGEEIFRTNCQGAFNVYEAAAQAGIKRVVSGSSIDALGFNYGIRDFEIQYFPLDEDHPAFTTDPYSFSKATLESIAAYYWRREGISGVCLRLPGVYRMTPDLARVGQQIGPAISRAYQTLVDLPAEEQRASLESLAEWLALARAGRWFEKSPHPQQDEEQATMQGGNQWNRFGVTDFWSLISVQDAAQAFEKAVLADYEGSHPLLVCEAENITGLPSEDLLRVYYPRVKARKRPIPGAASLVSYDKARSLIGFEPRHTIRDFKA